MNISFPGDGGTISHLNTQNKRSMIWHKASWRDVSKRVAGELDPKILKGRALPRGSRVLHPRDPTDLWQKDLTSYHQSSIRQCIPKRATCVRIARSFSRGTPFTSLHTITSRLLSMSTFIPPLLYLYLLYRLFLRRNAPTQKRLSFACLESVSRNMPHLLRSEGLKKFVCPFKSILFSRLVPPKGNCLQLSVKDLHQRSHKVPGKKDYAFENRLEYSNKQGGAFFVLPFSFNWEPIENEPWIARRITIFRWYL